MKMEVHCLCLATLKSHFFFVNPGKAGEGGGGGSGGGVISARVWWVGVGKGGER